MKTNPLFLLLALAFSAAPLLADDLCGGADDDQKSGDPTNTTDVTAPRPKWAPLCGGMDDDQLRLPPARGIVSGTLGVTVASGLHGDDGSDTLAEFDALWSMLLAPPVLRGIESDPFGLWGDNGTDSARAGARTSGGNGSITGDSGTDTVRPACGIVGGDGADFLRGIDPFFIQLIYGKPGPASLGAGGGDDEKRAPMPPPAR